MIKHSDLAESSISHVQLINFSQEAKIQHVSKHFPFAAGAVHGPPKTRPACFDLVLSKVKSPTRSKGAVRSNVWTLLELIETGGFSVPRLQLHLIKQQVAQLVADPHIQRQYQEVNYWGQVMTKTRDYHVIVGLRRALGLGLASMDFWVTQDFAHWTHLALAPPEVVRYAK